MSRRRVQGSSALSEPRPSRAASRKLLSAVLLGPASAKSSAPSGDDTEIARLEDRLKLHHLEQFKIYFQSHRPAPPTDPGSRVSTRSKRRERRLPGLLTLEEFTDVVAKVLKTQAYQDQIGNLFTKLDSACDGYVDWNEFCTFVLLQLREKDFVKLARKPPVLDPQRIKHIVHNRQETTAKILALENGKYATISKEGAAVVWDSSLHIERCHQITWGDMDSGSVQRRRVRMWITDACYMPNVHKVAVASTGRDLKIFDTTSSQYLEEYDLYGLPNVFTCLHYWYEEKDPTGVSLLICGVDSGCITIFQFLKPAQQLFDTAFKKEEGVCRVFMPDYPASPGVMRLIRLSDVHSESIRKVMYMPDNDGIICSSGDLRHSLVIIDVQRKKKSYVFKATKGVECFDYNKVMNVVVTGSTDHDVRLWNPYVTSKPIAVLSGHNMAIVDVAIDQNLGVVFSYSRDCVLKAWDPREHVCLQTVTLHFPSNLTGRLPEHGVFAMLLHRHDLLVASSDYLAGLKLGQAAAPLSHKPTSHSAQLCSALYNPRFRQVITGADDSSIIVWDLDCGAKNLLIKEAHECEEITCLTLDGMNRRLISGARDGTVKLWNMQNGAELTRLQPVDDTEVTGVVQLSDKSQLLTVGWCRKLTLYDDTRTDVSVIRPRSDWKGGQLHHDDILTVDYCPPNLLATGSFDGQICVWSMETEMLYLQLRKPDPFSIRKSESATRPNSRHRPSHRPDLGHPAPVDKLMFLRSRMSAKRPEAAVLVSSEAGILRWWSIYGVKHEIGYFYAPQHADESVLAMCTDASAQVLYTGDTDGQVAAWDVEDYCISQAGLPCVEAPPEVSRWSAHEGAVVSVAMLDPERSCGRLLLTASTDHTARLWTLHGQCIGIFGQVCNSYDSEQEATDDAKFDVPVSLEVEESRNAEQGDVPSARHVNSATQRNAPPGLPSLTRDKSLLGCRADRDFARIMHSRQERRETYGGINSNATSRLGRLCCPYQALSTQTLSEVRSDFPTLDSFASVSRELTEDDSHNYEDLNWSSDPREDDSTTPQAPSYNKQHPTILVSSTPERTSPLIT